MASRLCSEIGTSHGCAIWREDPEGSLRHCRLMVGSMALIFAEMALYGSEAVITNPAKSGRASGSASHGMRTGSCDFIFGAVRSSAVQHRLGDKRTHGVGNSDLVDRSALQRGREAPRSPHAMFKRLTRGFSLAGLNCLDKVRDLA